GGRAAGRPGYLSDDPVWPLGNVEHLVTAQDASAKAGRPGFENPLDLVLEDTADGKKRAFDYPEVQGYAAEVHLPGRVGIGHSGVQAALVEYLHRASGEAETS